ncbi:MAG: acyltransferase family protein [Promethearchaeota archaeon]
MQKEVESTSQYANKFQNQRYKVLDVMRGISMFYMMITHLCQFALIPEDKWLWAFFYVFIDIIGVPAFLFISGIATSISMESKYKRNLERGIPKKIISKSIRNDAFYRGFFVLFIGFLYNIGFAITQGGIKYIWGWTILQLMGFTQILLYYIKKLSLQSRFILMFGILILSDPLLHLLYGNPNYFLNFLGFILFNPSHMDPPLPFLFYPILGTTIGDIMMNDETVERHDLKFMGKKFRSYLVIIGLILLGLGILMGYRGEPAQEENWPFSIIMKEFNIEFLPDFFDRGSPSNILYCSGILMLLFSIFNRYYMRIYSKKHRVYTFFSLFGRASLTIFLGHHLFYFIINKAYNAYTIWWIATIVVGIISMIYVAWYLLADLKYGIEWIISATRSLFFKKLKSKNKNLEKKI